MEYLSLSPSSLDTFLFCPRYYMMEKIMGYSFAKGKPSEPKSIGKLIHEILAIYYKVRMTGELNLGAIVPDLIEHMRFLGTTKYEEISAESLEKACQMVKEYIFFYLAENWEPLAVEQPFSKLLYESDNLTVLSEGIIDLAVEVNGQFNAIVDHKWSTRNSKRSKLETQFINYAWASGVNRFIVNNLVEVKEDRLSRVLFNYTEGELKEWHQETVFRMRELESYLLSEYFPGNFTSCTKSRFGFCKFLEVCEHDESLRLEILERDFEKETEAKHDVYEEVK